MHYTDHVWHLRIKKWSCNFLTTYQTEHIIAQFRMQFTAVRGLKAALFLQILWMFVTDEFLGWSLLDWIKLFFYLLSQWQESPFTFNSTGLIVHSNALIFNLSLGEQPLKLSKSWSLKKVIECKTKCIMTYFTVYDKWKCKLAN